MKSDEDVRMISAEAPVLFAKACEMFIQEMTLRAYYYAEKNKRRTLQRSDIAQAVARTEIYDFLLDVMPRDEILNGNRDQMDPYQLEALNQFHILKLHASQANPPAFSMIAPGIPPVPGKITAGGDRRDEDDDDLSNNDDSNESDGKK